MNYQTQGGVQVLATIRLTMKTGYLRELRWTGPNKNMQGREIRRDEGLTGQPPLPKALVPDMIAIVSTGR